MRRFRHILVVIAAIAYGAMPLSGMAGETPDVAVVASVDAQSAAGTHHALPSAKGTKAAADSDCPHPVKAGLVGHCAACLTLAAQWQSQQPRPAAPPAPAPSLTERLSSHIAAPLLPPPRA